MIKKIAIPVTRTRKAPFQRGNAVVTPEYMRRLAFKLFELEQEFPWIVTGTPYIELGDD